MLGNGIKQTTATTGTGSLTLSAVTGYPLFSDAFPLNAMISYALLDAAGLFIESGIGYLSSSTVLVRAAVQSTFDGGTYVSQGATAASLSGTTTVICAQHAGSARSGFATVDSQSASVLRNLSSASRLSVFANLTATANRQVYTAFELKSAVVLTSLSMNVVTAGAALTIARIGLYSCNEKGYPGALLAGNGVAHDTATTGARTETLGTPLFLPAGWYFTAMACSGVPVVTGYSLGAQYIVGGGVMGFGAIITLIDYRYETLGGGFSSLASPANSTTTAQNAGSFSQPLVLLGVQ